MQKLLLGLVLSLAVAGNAVAQTTDSDVNEHIRRSRNLWINDQWVSAILEANEARQIAIKKYGIDSLEVAAAELQRSFAAMQTGDRFVLPYLLHALSIREKHLAEDSPEIADVLTQIGFYWTHQGAQPGMAIEPLERAVRIYQRNDPLEQLTNSLGALADAYRLSNNRGKALNAYAELAGIYQQREGAHNNQQFAFQLQMQAQIMDELGDKAAAASLRARANQISALATGENPSTESSPLEYTLRVNGLIGERRFAEAERILRDVINSKVAIAPLLGDTTREQIDAAKLLLVDVLVATKRFDEAEKILSDALSSITRDWGYDNGKYLQTMQRGIQLFAVQGRYVEADRLVRAIDDYYQRKGRVPTAPEVRPLVDYFVKQSRYEDALAWAKRGWQPILDRKSNLSLAMQDDWLTEQKAAQSALLTHLQVVVAAFAAGALNKRLDVLDDAFKVAQLARASHVGQVVAKMAARRAQAGDSFAIRLREIQDEYSAIEREEAQFLKLIVSASAEKNASIEAMRKKLIARKASNQAKEQALAAQYPRYELLVNQAPLSIQEAAGFLRTGEALITYTVDQYQTFVTIVRPEGSAYTATGGSVILDPLVRSFRKKITSGESGMPEPMRPDSGKELFAATFRGLDKALEGVNHIFLVLDGPLQSVPFAALPDGEGDAADWLAKRYAFSYLPSVASLRSLRMLTAAVTETEPFVGFGDPALNDGAQATTLALNTVFARAAGKSRALADLTMLRDAASLPETADELRSVADSLGANQGSVYLRHRATETAVKTIALSHYRVVSFATHGVMAGELAEDTEPGLVLTPPSTATEMDDGYLSASEVSGLKLNADWVILSACNTAAPDGRPGAEGFSGLANAFLYAGARAVLVSNWRVSSDATTALMKSTMARYAKDSSSKAFALQRAMLDLMEQPRYSHPYYWAPFSVVGD